MRTKDEVIKTYLVALKEIHSALQYTDKISVTAVAKKHKIGKSLSHILISGGILKTNGKQGNAIRYTWAAPIPNLKMAEELRNRLNSYILESQIRNNTKANRQKPEKTKKVEKVTQTKTVIETSYFWGLYKTTKTITK